MSKQHHKPTRMSKAHVRMIEAKLTNIAKDQAHLFFGQAIFASDLFFSVMRFVPAFPNLFRMRRVSRSWQAYIEHHIYDQVDTFDFLDHLGAAKIEVDLEVLLFLMAVCPNVTKLYLHSAMLILEKHSQVALHIRTMGQWKLQELHIVSDECTWKYTDVAKLPPVAKIVMYGFDFAYENIFSRPIEKKLWYSSHKLNDNSSIVLGTADDIWKFITFFIRTAFDSTNESRKVATTANVH